MMNALFIVSCTGRVFSGQKDGSDDTMFQSATLQSLMIGNYDGYIDVADDNVMVPFAVATHFDNDISFSLDNITCHDSLLAGLTDAVDKNGQNLKGSER